MSKLPAAWANVTLRQALKHTSGLPEFTRTNAYQDSLNAHPRKFRSPAALIGFVRKKPLDFTPGTKYQYSNTDNVVIAMMARAASHGRSYRGLLRSNVLKPLRLGRTTLSRGFRLPRPFVHGYQLNPPHHPFDISTALSMSVAWASGGIQSTPRNLNRFIRAYVGGRLFRPRHAAPPAPFRQGPLRATWPQGECGRPGDLRYRTGCGTVFGHTGTFPGYTQFAASSPSGRRSVTVAVNEMLQLRDGRPFEALRHAELAAVCAALR